MRSVLICLLIVSSVSFLTAQSSNKIVQDEQSGKPMLIGQCTREAFSDTSFAGWFNSEYNMYQPDTVTVKEIEYNLDDVKTTIIMGTWCSDSREQVPHFFKVMDKAGYPEDAVSIICVNRDKSDSAGSVDSLDIELVPTLIFYRDGKEIGRITETPQKTMEEDIFTILSKGTD
jgi:thiol-disulfide isomerase/thioredoxin